MTIEGYTKFDLKSKMNGRMSSFISVIDKYNIEQFYINYYSNLYDRC